MLAHPSASLLRGFLIQPPLPAELPGIKTRPFPGSKPLTDEAFVSRAIPVLLLPFLCPGLGSYLAMCSMGTDSYRSTDRPARTISSWISISSGETLVISLPHMVPADYSQENPC